MMKIYCEGCHFRNRQYHPDYSLYRDYCRRQVPDDAYDDYLASGNFSPVECSDRNSKNDCEYFMKKVGFWGWFRLVFFGKA